MSNAGPSKLWLYGPIGFFVLLVGAYCAYWFVAEDLIEAGVDDWVEEQRLDGIEVSFASKDVRGFPYRFTLDVDKPSYHDMRSGIRWRGDALEIVMQPWNYRHAIARAPGRNEVVAFGTSSTALIDDRSAISFRWDEDGITSIGLTLDEADLVSEFGDVSVGGLDVHFGAGDVDTRFNAEWNALSLSPELLEAQSYAFLGSDIQNGQLAFLINGVGRDIAEPVGERDLQLAALRLNWGPLKLGVKGKFDITPRGSIDGPLQVRLDDTDDLSSAIGAAGIGGPEVPLIIQAIGEASKDGQFLTLPIKNGELKFLGFTLAQIPPIFPPVAGSNILAQ